MQVSQVAADVLHHIFVMLWGQRQHNNWIALLKVMEAQQRQLNQEAKGDLEPNPTYFYSKISSVKMNGAFSWVNVDRTLWYLCDGVCRQTSHLVGLMALDQPRCVFDHVTCVISPQMPIHSNHREEQLA